MAVSPRSPQPVWAWMALVQLTMLFVCGLLASTAESHSLSTSMVYATSSSNPTPLPTPQATPFPALISPPSRSSSEYRLKNWTLADAQEAIAEGEIVVGATDDWASLQRAQPYLLLVEREGLLRFPQIDRDAINWKLIRQDAIVNYYDEYGPKSDMFLHLFDQALNSGQVTEGNLEPWLAARGFTLGERSSIFNMFGDGQWNPVFQIDIEDSLLEYGLVIVLRGSTPGNYRSISPWPRWYAFGGAIPAEISILDYNGNGRPEIVSLTGVYGHAVSRFKLAIDEWNGDAETGRFQDIAPLEAEFWCGGPDMICEFPWSFGALDARGVRPLIATFRYYNWAGASCPDYLARWHGEWDGQRYRWVRADIVPYGLQSQVCMAGWAQWAALDSAYDHAIPILRYVLDFWPKKLEAVWGPSARDYFRFKVGTWYAFAGRYGQAIATLEQVRDHPANSQYDMASRMARSFLSNYRTGASAEEACQTVADMLDKEFSIIWENDHNSDGYDVTKSHWGFGEPTWDWWPPNMYTICDHRDGRALPSDYGAPKLSTYDSYPNDEPTYASERIERALFVQSNISSAAQMAQEYLKLDLTATLAVERSEEPHIEYLVGLIGELSGDERQAVAAYWQLWRDHPDSLYAQLARRKLELVTQ